MTEFAYSGLGINPHYGTPRNAFDRAAGRIPGGSSSARLSRWPTAWPPRPSVPIPADPCAFPRRSMDSSPSNRPPGACRSTACCRVVTLDSAGPIARRVADCVPSIGCVVDACHELPAVSCAGCGSRSRKPGARRPVVAVRQRSHARSSPVRHRSHDSMLPCADSRVPPK